MKKRQQYDDITEAINSIGDEVNSVLNNRQKEKYFDGVVLLYSFIENVLKWLIFVQLLWSKSGRVVPDKEMTELQRFCKSLNFYQAQHIALSLDVIDWKLFQRIDAIRQERNDVIHQFWLYVHRGNNLVLRKKLEKLAGVASQLVENTKKLTREIGVDEVYKISL